jgi:Ran GTPase-activating protein (RanGAP) involved in mRNA processing and transport
MDMEKGKFAKKLLVVSRFRLVLMKTGFFGKVGVEKNIPILDVDSILEQGGGTLVIESKKFGVEFGVKTGDVVGFLKAIRKSYRWMNTGIGESNRMKLNVYKDLLVELDPLKDGEIQGMNGIINAYGACCNYLGRKQKETMKRYLKDLSERGIVDLCLDDCPQESGNASSKASIMDYEPLMMALGMNDFFESLTSEYVTFESSSGSSASGCIEAFGRAMSKNRRIRRIELVGVGISDISTFGNSLKISSNFHQVSILNLSKNRLSEKGVMALASAIEVCNNHSMQSINLSECEISGKGMASLFDSFFSNLFFSLSIQSLFIGGNYLNDLALNSMMKWMRRGRSQSHLEYLSLANAHSISLESLLGSLSYITSRMRWIDLSGIKLGDQERPAVETFIPKLVQASRMSPSGEFTGIESGGIGGSQRSSSSSSSTIFSPFFAPSPRNLIGLPSYASFDDDEDLPIIESSPPLLSDYAMTLVMRKCSLSQDMVVESLIPSLKKNKDMKRVCLDVSGNDLTNTTMTMMTQLLSDWNPIISLRLADVKLRPRTLVNFLNTPPPSLQRLDISGCLAQSSPTVTDISELTTSFKQFLTTSKYLSHLIISNNRPCMTGSGSTGISGVIGSVGSGGNASPSVPSTPIPSGDSSSSSPLSLDPSSNLLSSIIDTLMSPSSSPIRYFDLEDNLGGDFIGHRIGNLLRINKTITHLRLDGNLIGFHGWQSIVAGMSQPPRGNESLFDLPIPAQDINKATKSLPNSRQPLLLAMIANLKASLDRNTPRETLKKYLQKSLNATPTTPWPSLLKAMDSDQVDSMAAQLVNPAGSTDSVIISAPSSASKTSVAALVNPRSTLSIPSSIGNDRSSSRSLGIGLSSRASIMISPSALQEMGFNSSIGSSSMGPSSSSSSITSSLSVPDDIGRGRRKSFGPLPDTLAPASVFFAVGRGRSGDDPSSPATAPLSAESFEPI